MPAPDSLFFVQKSRATCLIWVLGVTFSEDGCLRSKQGSIGQSKQQITGELHEIKCTMGGCDGGDLGRVLERWPQQQSGNQQRGVRGHSHDERLRCRTARRRGGAAERRGLEAVLQ